MPQVVDTSTSSNTNLLTTYILRDFIPFLQDELHFADAASPAMLPSVSGNVARWLLLATPVAATTALNETSASGGQISAQVTVTKVEGTIADYGAWFPIGDLAETTGVSSMMDQYTKLMAFNGALTLDTLLYNAATATTNFLVPGQTTLNTGVVTASTSTGLGQDIHWLANNAYQQKAKPFPQFGQHFLLIVHPKVEGNIVADVTNTRLTWSESLKYVNGPTGQINLVNTSKGPGTLFGVQVERSTVITTTALTTVTTPTASASLNAYRNVFLADDGLGWLKMSDARPRIIIKTSGPQDTNQPLSMYSTLGWKLRGAFKLLDSARVFSYYAV